MDCKDCNAKCCKYVTVNLSKPKTEDDWDEIRWFLLHEDVAVYKDCDGDWMVEFTTRCKNLNKSGHCKDYDKRPIICREHEVSKCEANDKEHFMAWFNKPSDVDSYRNSKTID